jgi:hypothetical protein
MYLGGYSGYRRGYKSGRRPTPADPGDSVGSIIPWQIKEQGPLLKVIRGAVRNSLRSAVPKRTVAEQSIVKAADGSALESEGSRCLALGLI